MLIAPLSSRSGHGSGTKQAYNNQSFIYVIFLDESPILSNSRLSKSRGVVHRDKCLVFNGSERAGLPEDCSEEHPYLCQTGEIDKLSFTCVDTMSLLIYTT